MYNNSSLYHLKTSHLVDLATGSPEHGKYNEWNEAVDKDDEESCKTMEQCGTSDRARKQLE